VFARPEHRQRAKVLGELSGTISEATIEIVRALDPRLLRPEIVTRLWDSGQALELQEAVALAKECAPDLTDEAIAQSIRRIGPNTSLSSWLQRLLGRAKRFPNRPPIEDDHELRGLHTAEALRDAGRRFCNCVGTRVSAVALSRAYYLEWLATPAIIELTALSEGRWVLEGVWGSKNRNVESQVIRAIGRKLSGYGVLLPIQHAHGYGRPGVAKLLQFFEYTGLDLAELENSVATA
jgi:hypothetical protein